MLLKEINSGISNLTYKFHWNIQYTLPYHRDHPLYRQVQNASYTYKV